MSDFIELPVEEAKYIHIGSNETEHYKYMTEHHDSSNQHELVIFEKATSHYFKAFYHLDEEDHPEEEPFDHMGEFIRFYRVYPHYHTVVDYNLEPPSEDY